MDLCNPWFLHLIQILFLCVSLFLEQLYYTRES